VQITAAAGILQDPVEIIWHYFRHFRQYWK